MLPSFAMQSPISKRCFGINHSFPTHWTALSFLTLKLSNLGLFDGTNLVVPVFS